jgi:AbrB family looped-hinge helix DNA binding protein
MPILARKCPPYRRLPARDFQRPIVFTFGLAYTNGRVNRDYPASQRFKEVLTLSVPIVDNAKVMAKGQITLPKDIRSKLRLSTGDRVTLICEEDRVILMNSAIYAMKMLRQEMKGEAEKAGVQTDDDVMALVKDVRAEIEGL